MIMKKLISKIFAAMLCAALVFSFAACGDGMNDEGKTETPSTVNVYMPDGAPAVALAAFMDGGYDRAKFTVVTPAAVIAQRVSSGDADLAVMPINAAATLYNGGKDIVMLTVNTHGNLFIVGDGDGITLDDLVGKRLGVIGEGNVPDQVLRMLLDAKGIGYEKSEEAVTGKVALTYADDGGVLLPLLKQGKVDYAFLAEPAATTAVGNFSKKIVADVQELWRAQFGGGYPQACLVGQGKFVRENKAYVDKFIKDLAAVDGWAEQNPDKALAAISSHMESGATTSLKILNANVVKNCNIKTVAALEMKSVCDGYFQKLTELKTGLGTTVLKKVPDENFYYKA